MARGKFEKERKTKAKKSSAGASKTNRTLLKVLIVVLAILLILMSVAAVVLTLVWGKVGRFDDASHNPNEVIEEFETDPAGQDGETYETVDPNSVTWGQVETMTDEDIINILLIGQDARPGETRARSDTMILLSLNTKTNAIQMTSFMRDMYVQIPGYNDNRINAAYAFGGHELLNETLNTNFGVEVDGNVAVNFEVFEKVIDILGGVDVKMDSEEAASMRKSGYDATEGMNHLDGEAALSFVRMRYLSGSDYMRTERQRRLIGSVIESMKGAGITEIMGLINDVLPYVATDMEFGEILDYATKGLTALNNGGEISSLRIPADDAHYAASINGMSVLVPDLEMCQEDLREFIYNEAE